MKLVQRLAIGYIRTKFKWMRHFSKRKTAEAAFRLFCTPYIRTRNKNKLHNAEPLSFQFESVSIRGYRWNHPQPKKALLLHGFNSAAHKFAEYALALSAKGYEVLAFDAPAHGNSGGKMVNALVYSSMIKKVNELYGPVDSYITHSFGGLAITLALEELPHDAGTRVVLIAPATETTSAIDSAFKLLGLDDQDVRREFEHIIYTRSGRQTEWFSVRRAVRQLRARILWVHDEDDDVTPWEDAERVKNDNHPHIEFVVTKGLGHQKIYRDDTIKSKVTGFL